MLSSYTFILFVWQSNTKSSILLMSNKWICVLKVWARSSDWESAALARQRPRVQIPVGPLLFICNNFCNDFYLCSTFSLWIVCEGIILLFFGYSCISNPTGTNKPNFSCLLSILHMWKKTFCLFFKRYV